MQHFNTHHGIATFNDSMDITSRGGATTPVNDITKFLANLWIPWDSQDCRIKELTSWVLHNPAYSIDFKQLTSLLRWPVHREMLQGQAHRTVWSLAVLPMSYDLTRGGTVGIWRRERRKERERKGGGREGKEEYMYKLLTSNMWMLLIKYEGISQIYVNEF